MVGYIPDLLEYMVTTYAALDPMYVDVVSCSSGHFGSCGTYTGYTPCTYVRIYTYLRSHVRIPSTRASVRSCNCVTHN